MSVKTYSLKSTANDKFCENLFTTILFFILRIFSRKKYFLVEKIFPSYFVGAWPTHCLLDYSDLPSLVPFKYFGSPIWCLNTHFIHIIHYSTLERVNILHLRLFRSFGTSGEAWCHGKNGNNITVVGTNINSNEFRR